MDDSPENNEQEIKAKRNNYYAKICQYILKKFNIHNIPVFALIVSIISVIFSILGFFYSCDVARISNRSYLSVNTPEFLDPFMPGDTLKIKTKISNVGRTSAEIITAYYALEFDSLGKFKKTNLHEINIPKTIVPNTDTPFTMSGDFKMTWDDIANFQNYNKTVFIYIFASYSDPFGNKDTISSTYRWSYIRQEWEFIE